MYIQLKYEYTHTHIYTYIHTHIYINTYTYIHAQIGMWSRVGLKVASRSPEVDANSFAADLEAARGTRIKEQRGPLGHLEATWRWS